MTLIDRDLAHVWHPCMQMKDFETISPLDLVGAQGDRLIDRAGRHIIDATASWWCKSLGHQHPRLMHALREQSQRFEHVILANTTHEKLIELSERLCDLAPSLQHVFYASEGSSAVEIALKMAVHAQALRGQGQRQKLVALANGYHGETCLALSVSDLGLYKEPYQALLQPVTFLQSLPYVNQRQDPHWQDCADVWPTIECQLAPLAHTAAAIIIEPVLQGAGGMRLYSPDLLRRLRHWCDEHQVFFIADEIMTGLGRTGKALACEHAGIVADMVCLSKGLTAGVLPLSAMLTTEAIYQLFYDDYQTGKAFLHSHTYCGNALAVAVAHEVLTILEEENIYQQVLLLEAKLLSAFKRIQAATGRLTQIRALGGVVAAELLVDDTTPPRLGFAVSRDALALGALLRPLGNTLYWCPPLNVSDETLAQLEAITLAAIQLNC